MKSAKYSPLISQNHSELNERRRKDVKFNNIIPKELMPERIRDLGHRSEKFLREKSREASRTVKEHLPALDWRGKSSFLERPSVNSSAAELNGKNRSRSRNKGGK